MKNFITLLILFSFVVVSLGLESKTLTLEVNEENCNEQVCKIVFQDPLIAAQEFTIRKINISVVGTLSDEKVKLGINDVTFDNEISGLKVSIESESYDVEGGFPHYHYNALNYLLIENGLGRISQVTIEFIYEVDQVSLRRSTATCPAIIRHTFTCQNSASNPTEQKTCYKLSNVFSKEKLVTDYKVSIFECRGDEINCKVISNSNQYEISDNMICIDPFSCKRATSNQNCFKNIQITTKTASKSCKPQTFSFVVSNGKAKNSRLCNQNIPSIKGKPIPQISTGSTTRAITTGITTGVTTGATTGVTTGDGSCPVIDLPYNQVVGVGEACSVHSHCIIYNACENCVCTPACFLPDTLILMADHTYKRIIDMKSGDLVIGSEGQIRRVLALTNETLNANYVIGFNGGEAFFSPEHPFLNPETGKILIYDLEFLRAKDTPFDLTHSDLEEMKDDGSQLLSRFNNETKIFENIKLEKFTIVPKNPQEIVHFLITDSITLDYTGNGYVTKAPGQPGSLLIIDFGVRLSLYRMFENQLKSKFDSEPRTINYDEFVSNIGAAIEKNITSVIQSRYVPSGSFSYEYSPEWLANVRSNLDNLDHETSVSCQRLMTHQGVGTQLFGLYTSPSKDGIEFINSVVVPALKVAIESN